MHNNCTYTAQKLPAPFIDTYIVSCAEHGILGVFNKEPKYDYSPSVNVYGEQYYESMPYGAFVKRYN